MTRKFFALVVVVAALASSSVTAQSPAPPAQPETPASTVAAPDASKVPPLSAGANDAVPITAPETAESKTTPTVVEAPSVADVKTPTLPTLVPISFMGVASSEPLRFNGARVDEEIRSELFSDPGVQFTPSGAPLLTEDCIDDTACLTANAAGYEAPWVVVAKLSEGATPVASVADSAATTKTDPPAAAPPAPPTTTTTVVIVLFDRATGIANNRVTIEGATVDDILGQMRPAMKALLVNIHPRGAPEIELPEATTVATTEAPTESPSPSPSTEPDDGLWPTEPVSRVKTADDENDPVPARALDVAPKPAPVAAAPAERELDTLTMVSIAGFAIGGLIMSSAGVVFDLASPTSVNGTIDALDFVGPGLVVSGVALGMAGAVTMYLWQPFAGDEDEKK